MRFSTPSGWCARAEIAVGPLASCLRPALVGLPGDAQTDLDEARKRVDADQPHLPPPDWVRLIDAYLAGDPERLGRSRGRTPNSRPCFG